MVGVSVIDSYNVATQYLSYEDTHHALLCAFSEEIIDNDIDSLVLIQVITYSGLCVSSAWTLCFTKFGIFFKWFELHFKIPNTFDKYIPTSF